MKRISESLLVLVVSVVVLMGFWGLRAEAQLAVTLETDPDIQVITLDAAPQEILIIARSTQEQVEFTWQLDGPGQLQGDLTSPGIVYIPPDAIEEPATQVEISVKVTDETGAEKVEKVIFTLMLPTPTPTPIPPTPTPTPKPVQIRHIMLKDAQETIMNPMYKIGRGKTLSLEVDVSHPEDRSIEVKCTAIRGTVDYYKGKIIYTAPNKLGAVDMITVKAVDSESGTAVIQKVIKVEIVE